MKKLSRDNSSKMLVIMHFLSLTSIYVPSFQSLLYFPRYCPDKHLIRKKMIQGEITQ